MTTEKPMVVRGRIRSQRVVVATTTGAYTANDAVGQLLQFDKLGLEAGQGFVVLSVVFMEGTDTPQVAALDLRLYASQVGAPTDNSAYDPTEADNKKSLGTIPISAYPTSVQANNEVGTARSVGLACVAEGPILFGVLTTSGTPTYAQGDCVILLTIALE